MTIGQLDTDFGVYISQSYFPALSIRPMETCYGIFISKYQVRGKKECEVSRLLRSHCIIVQVAPDVLEGIVGQYMPCDMASHARRLTSSAILVFEPHI